MLADRTTLRVRARGLEASTTRVEVVLLERDGAAWGTNVPLTTEWQDVRVPLGSLRYFSHWAGTPQQPWRTNDRLHPENLVAVSVCFGAWLYPDHVAEPHTIEMEKHHGGMSCVPLLARCMLLDHEHEMAKRLRFILRGGEYTYVFQYARSASKISIGDVAGSKSDARIP